MKILLRRIWILLPALWLLAGAPAEAIEIKQVKSAKGLSAWLVEDHTNPIFTMEFAFRGGSALDPAGKEGVANLVSATLDEGAGDIRSQAFQQELEDLSISLRYSAGRDNFTGSFRTLTRNRDRAFELLRLSLTKPRFDSEAVERVRGQILSGIRRRQENPRRIAGRALMEAFFPDHPYGRPARGTLETVPVIKLADLKVFAAERFARDNLVISVVGDVTPDELAKMLDATFGGLPATARPWKLAEAKPPARNRTIVIEKSIPQSVIQFGQPGIKRDHPDFFPAYVMNYVLGGGGFESRLYEEVREKRGLAYSASSYLYPWNHAALILGGAGTANARVGETLKVLQDEWRRMWNRGLTAEELKDAKTYLTGSYPLRFSSSGRIASLLTGIQLQELGIDYIDKRNGLINAITLDGVNRVAKKILNPDGLTTIVVGKPVGVTSQN